MTTLIDDDINELLGKSHSPAHLVVKREIFVRYLTGEKKIEYRRHRGKFTSRVFWRGRRVRIAYSYDPAKSPHLIAVVRFFDVVRIEDTPNEVQKRLFAHYPDLRLGDEIAAIHLEVIEKSDLIASYRAQGSAL